MAQADAAEGVEHALVGEHAARERKLKAEVIEAIEHGGVLAEECGAAASASAEMTVSCRDRKPASWSRRQIAVPDQVLLLLLVARRQLEQARCGAAKDVVLRSLREKGDVPDRAWQIEIPVRIIGGVE